MGFGKEHVLDRRRASLADSLPTPRRASVDGLPTAKRGFRRGSEVHDPNDVILINELKAHEAILQKSQEQNLERIHELEAIVLSMRTAAVLGDSVFRPGSADDKYKFAKQKAATRIQSRARGLLARAGWSPAPASAGPFSRVAKKQASFALRDDAGGRVRGAPRVDLVHETRSADQRLRRGSIGANTYSDDDVEDQPSPHDVGDSHEDHESDDGLSGLFDIGAVFDHAGVGSINRDDSELSVEPSQPKPLAKGRAGPPRLNHPALRQLDVVPPKLEHAGSSELSTLTRESERINESWMTRGTSELTENSLLHNLQLQHRDVESSLNLAESSQSPGSPSMSTNSPRKGIRMQSFRTRKGESDGNGGSSKTCFSRFQRSLSRVLASEAFDFVVASYSFLYLLVICAELVFADVVVMSDEVCDIDVNATATLLDKANAAAASASIFVLIDFCFVCLFMIELTMRILATGKRFFLTTSGQARYINIFDLCVILASFAIDLLMLYPPDPSQSISLSFLRLSRLLRVVRIFNVISRVSRSRRRYRRRRKRALARILAPPTCNWTSAKRSDGATSKPYVCFLSHFKAEAATDARYLYDLLSSITQAPVYLDSTKLTDLHTLFTEGVQQSEVVVLLASEHVLTRPWCLLELYEAGRLGIPVIPLGLEKVHRTAAAKPKFDLLSARHFVNNLESMLELANPGALADLTAHLAASGTPLRQFKTVVLEALKVADPRVVRLGAPQIPTWHSGGTDAQLLADVKDLINAMAEATGRSDSLHFSREEEDTSMNSLGMTWSSCVDCMKSLCCCGTRSDTEQYAVYISCDPEEASDVARYLQCALTRKFALPVVQEIGPELKDDCIEDQLNLGVGRSHALLLLLSSGVFSRPWTLLQVYEAIRLHKPIVCVEVQGGGHNHGAAKAWLKSLRTELGKRLLSRLHARTLFSDPSLASLKRRPQPSWRDDRDAPHPPRARQLVPTIARSPLLRHPLHHRHLVHTKRLSEPCRRGACRHLRAVSKREAGVISQLECAAEEVLGRDQAQPVVRRDPAR